MKIYMYSKVQNVFENIKYNSIQFNWYIDKLYCKYF